MTRSELAALALRTQEVYERNAARFDRERPKSLHERVWLDRFLGAIPPGAAVLDLGCGAGDPIAAHMAQRGFRVTGVDASRAMLEIALQRYPQGDWQFGDMRQLDLGRRFSGILAWNSFFHLTAPEQRVTLERIALHLEPGGVAMLTVGPEASEVAGRVGGDAVYHASLSPQEYRDRLDALGLEILQFVAEDPECDRQTVLLARKRMTG